MMMMHVGVVAVHVCTLSRLCAAYPPPITLECILVITTCIPSHNKAPLRARILAYTYTYNTLFNVYPIQIRGALRNPAAVEAAITAMQVAALKRVSKGTTVLLLDRYGIVVCIVCMVCTYWTMVMHAHIPRLSYTHVSCLPRVHIHHIYSTYTPPQQRQHSQDSCQGPQQAWV